MAALASWGRDEVRIHNEGSTSATPDASAYARVEVIANFRHPNNRDKL